MTARKLKLATLLNGQKHEVDEKFQFLFSKIFPSVPLSPMENGKIS